MANINNKMSTSLIKPKINRPVFFQRVRLTFFSGKLSQSQVNGFEHILNEWENRGLSDFRWLAYMLGTCYHETAKTIQPIEEYNKGKGRAYGRTVNGHIYYGRGWVQLTWLKNYKTFADLLKVDLVNHPELALDCTIATQILFEGMIKGLFTGRKLSDYFNGDTDWLNARKIINGLDCAEIIGMYGKRFLAALS
jgi:putative chitinase